VVHQQTRRQGAGTRERSAPEQALREEVAEACARDELMKPRIDGAGAERAERTDHELRSDQPAEPVRQVGNERQQGQREDHEAGQRDHNDRDLAALTQPLDQRDAGQLHRLHHQRDRREQADLHRP